MNSPQLFQDLERVVNKVVNGEAVFFIGAGFSVASEGNTAGALIRRLLTRFIALTEVWQNSPELGGSDAPKRSKALAGALATTFELRPRKGAVRRLLTDKNIERLTQYYYPINDWMCNAFGLMLDSLDEGVEADETLYAALESAVLRRECELDPKAKERPLELVRLMRLAAEHRGKALFLDAMGFASEEHMGGKPYDRDIAAVNKSYRRLLDRHHVLAWLAREGLTPTLVTTNYDLLIEGAYRLAGMMPLNPRVEPPLGLPQAGLSRFATIAGATTFFNLSDEQRSARLLKIHGCVHRYREARKREKTWQGILPSMVFTFREIQNWREDAWSRDYLSSLLRTNTMIFCGYSGADPVLHDTFRSIYEEMRARIDRESAPGAGHPDTRGLDPAFFFAPSGRLEFHGLEILRSASRVSGARLPALDDNDNYFTFEISSPFPSLDDLLLWIYHRTTRRLQRAALHSHLGRVYSVLFGHPPPADEHARVLERFENLCQQERNWCDRLAGREGAHREFRRVTGWTRWFRVGAMRELALAEAAARDPGTIHAVSQLRDWPWYYPSQGNGEWTAWTALLELALRSMILARSGAGQMENKSLLVGNPFVHVEASWIPTIAFATGAERPDLTRLSIRVAGDRREAMARRQGAADRRPVVWSIEPRSLPWVPGDSLRPTPSAGCIWDWASGMVTIPTPVCVYFGGPDDP